MGSQPPQPAGPPTTFDIAPILESSEYNVPIADYLAAQPSIKRLGASVVVFHGPRMLLIQRAPHDYLPLEWEIPGGAVEPTDATLLHAGARELWEESGLRAVRMRRCVDAAREFDDTNHISRLGVLRWRLVTFEAEVEGGSNAQEPPPAVTLDPAEHVAYLWATEDEVRARRCGEVELKFQFPEVVDMLMKAFAERRNRGGKGEVSPVSK